MRTCFAAIVLFFALAQSVFARELLVAQPPTYDIGDRVDMNFDTPLGALTISATYTGMCTMQRSSIQYHCAEVAVSASGVEMSSKVYVTPDWKRSLMIAEGQVLRLDLQGDMFPLYVGDVRVSDVLEAQPCRNPQYTGRTCMEPVGPERCTNYRRVSQGIEFFCEGRNGRTRTLMDHEFKFPIEVEFLP